MKKPKPSMAIYHATENNTGMALRLELYPALWYEYGSILMNLAPQKTFVLNEVGRPIPIFDWDNAISFRLGILELAKVLQVLRGQCGSINKGKGLYCRNDNGCTIVYLSHMFDPDSCYLLEVSHRPNKGGEIVSMRFELNYSEAFALSEVIGQAMLPVAFGVSFTKYKD